jgi:glycerophosphoryl diester phosphodiesterase
MRKKLLFVLAFLSAMGGLFLSGCMRNREQATQPDSVVEQYLETVASSDYIMHALGGMEGKYSYTNSIDALVANYAEGYRLFEVDVSFTSDEQLVLAHSSDDLWTKKDWEQRLGQPYDKDHPDADYDTFMSFLIQGKFRATSFAELLDFMETHDDMFVMIDIGNRSYERTVKIYSAIVDAAQGREGVLQHMIAGGHTTEMISAVKETYAFPILNLYFADEGSREETLRDVKDFADYCEDHQILSFSTASSTYTEADAAIFRGRDLICYVFTTNDEAEAQRLFDLGADVVGTDFLR